MAQITSPRPLFLMVFLVVMAAGVWYVAFRPAKSGTETPSNTAWESFDDVVPDPAPDDPRLTFHTPFRNVKPDVKYVGDSRCTECHTDICNTYHAHPMGRSAAFVNDASPLEKYDASSNNPFNSGNYQLDVTKTADGVRHRMTAKSADGSAMPEYTSAANLAIGSGTRGRSYVSIENGSVWQSPISWFTSETKWDVSPGFDLGNGGRRAIIAGCLLCHVNHVEAVPGSINSYREPLLGVQTSIGCERCHGPGELHVAERKVAKPTGKIDTSIVNPKHLSHDLQQSVCQQCHLQGQERVRRRGRNEAEYRPGLPFESFVSVFIRHPDLAESNRSVGQFEQTQQSHCKTAAGNSLLCTSCHDPHKVPAPAERDAQYRNACQKCHESKGCVAPAADRKLKNDSCTACHMPKAGSSNIAHASVTDHRIQRRPVAPPMPKGLAPGDSPLTVFRAGVTPPDEIQRDMGVAIARLTAILPPGNSRQMLGLLAREKLSKSLGTWRGDAEGWVAMARAQVAVGDRTERWKAAERAVRLEPDSEYALAELADAATNLKKFDRALEATNLLVERHPRSADHLIARINVYMATKQWDRALVDCRAVLKIQPLNVQALMLSAATTLRTGTREEADQKFETALRLTTNVNQKSIYRDWFEREKSLPKD